MDIADVLWHRSLNTSAIYAKVDLINLSAVASARESEVGALQHELLWPKRRGCCDRLCWRFPYATAGRRSRSC
jgi:hypothetical protein